MSFGTFFWGKKIKKVAYYTFKLIYLYCTQYNKTLPSVPNILIIPNILIRLGIFLLLTTEMDTQHEAFA